MEQQTVVYACLRCEPYKCRIADCPKSRAYKEARQRKLEAAKK